MANPAVIAGSGPKLWWLFMDGLAPRMDGAHCRTT